MLMVLTLVLNVTVLYNRSFCEQEKKRFPSSHVHTAHQTLSSPLIKKEKTAFRKWENKSSPQKTFQVFFWGCLKNVQLLLRWGEGLTGAVIGCTQMVTVFSTWLDCMNSVPCAARLLCLVKYVSVLSSKYRTNTEVRFIYTAAFYQTSQTASQ